MITMMAARMIGLEGVIRSFLRLIGGVSALLAFLAAVPVASAEIPASLKSSCAIQHPHPGYNFKFCNDGLPPVGGTTPNEAGTNAVKVPVRYQAFNNGDDWTGLPPTAGDLTMAGADTGGDIALDVDISLPTIPAPAGGYPLIVMMHGCCSGDKTSWEATSFDAAGEKWHYSNAWFAARGYVVITYTSRGFVNGESNGNRGSTGETQLDSRRFEINDFQHLAGLVADDPFFEVNPQKVVVTGGSYGGGFSWLALTDPVWNSPGGRPMKLAAAAPRYGWTDLVDSLVPTGRHFQEPDQLPAFDGSASTSPIGIPKQSIVAALYDSGKTGIPAGSAHTTFPSYIDNAFGCLQSSDPFETNPLCASTIQNTLPSFINDRSAYYQNQWFSNIASNASHRIPLFSAGTLTDTLFPAVEHRRMANRILNTVPGYPIQQYYGDYQHFTQNKAREWGDMCGTDDHVCTIGDYPSSDVNATPSSLKRTGVTTRLNGFIDYYAQPPGDPSPSQPSFDTTASLQICPSNAPLEHVASNEPGPTFTAPTFEGLATGRFVVDMTGTQATTNSASPNPHAVHSEPIANSQTNGGSCPVETSPAGAGVAVYDSPTLGNTETMIGAPKVSIDYSATSTQGSFQLDSRLYDVFPDNSAVLVDRGVRRVTAPSGTVTYELHGNGWRFHAGHKVRIEVAQDDAPYAKASTVPSSATLTHVKVDMPVRENYERPQSAGSLDVALVPVFRQCGTGGNPANGTHSAPLAVGSCNPPATLGVAHLGAQSTGTASLDVVPGDPSTVANEANVSIAATLTDVRSGSVTGADYTPNAGGPDLTLVAKLRISDLSNGSQNDPGTATDVDFPVSVDCAATPDPSVGATCSVNTTANAVMPGLVVEDHQAVVQIFRVRVNDAGANGVPADSDDRLFAQQGVFLP